MTRVILADCLPGWDAIRSSICVTAVRIRLFRYGSKINLITTTRITLAVSLDFIFERKSSVIR